MIEQDLVTPVLQNGFRLYRDRRSLRVDSGDMAGASLNLVVGKNGRGVRRRSAIEPRSPLIAKYGSPRLLGGERQGKNKNHHHAKQLARWQHENLAGVSGA